MVYGIFKRKLYNIKLKHYSDICIILQQKQNFRNAMRIIIFINMLNIIQHIYLRQK